jgi:hypothetical protein
MSSKKDSYGKFTGSERISGKKASDAFKSGNNAGMLFKKEAKNANDTKEYTMALHKLRIAENKNNGESLRGYFNDKN